MALGTQWEGCWVCFSARASKSHRISALALLELAPRAAHLGCEDTWRRYKALSGQPMADLWWAFLFKGMQIEGEPHKINSPACPIDKIVKSKPLGF